MEKRVKDYIDGLFGEVPETRQVAELKEELASNLIEKISDLVRSGRNEENAFVEAVASLGDTSELIDDLMKSHKQDFKYEAIDYEDTKRVAAGYSSATMLVILSVIASIIVYFTTKNTAFTAITFFTILLPAIGIYVYFGVLEEKSSAINSNDDWMNDWRKWKSHKSKRRKRIVNGLDSAIWMFSVCIFFIMGFEFGKWHYAWIVFVAAAGLQSLIDGFSK